MSTYEHGKADADAPVTWRISNSGITYIVSGRTVELYMDVDSHDGGEMDDICRAFHLAKLAEEAEGMLSRPRDEGEADWLRRYRAAKGES